MSAEQGHNSGIAANQLKSIIERVERLHEERKAIGSDISDVYKEAKGTGFDVGALKAIVKLRAEDPAKREERETIIDLYKSAIGMLDKEPSNTHAHARVYERPARETYQPYRIAAVQDLKEARRAGAPISQDQTFQNADVYFAISSCGTLMKVGLSNDATTRIGKVGADRGVEMEMWFTIPGNRQEELRCLEALEPWRERGEWFHFGNDVVEKVQELRLYYGLAPLWPARIPCAARGAQ